MKLGTGASVKLANVERGFAETGQVVSSMNLSVHPGEFVSFLGPSGCGKSTLLKMIADLDKPDSGDVAVNSFGRNFFRSFVFQDAQLLPWRTALDNCVLPLQLMKVSHAEALERATQALSNIGLADSLNKFPAQLSGGMRMRVSVARSLVSQPSLLLLDEPFAALDEVTRFKLQEDLRRLWENLGMTVIFVTHSVSEAVFLSDRAIVLSSRPAKILLDSKIELPRDRSRSLRTEPMFYSEVKKITAAYQSSGET